VERRYGSVLGVVLRRRGGVTMRDPKRINKICDLLREVWSKYPDWRLGQLLFNATQQYDIFFVEDEKMIEALKKIQGGD